MVRIILISISILFLTGCQAWKDRRADRKIAKAYELAPHKFSDIFDTTIIERMVPVTIGGSVIIGKFKNDFALDTVYQVGNDTVEVRVKTTYSEAAKKIKAAIPEPLKERFDALLDESILMTVEAKVKPRTGSVKVKDTNTTHEKTIKTTVKKKGIGNKIYIILSLLLILLIIYFIYKIRKK